MHGRYKFDLSVPVRRLRDDWVMTRRDQCHEKMVCIICPSHRCTCHTGPHGGTSMLVRRHTGIRKDSDQDVEKTRQDWFA